ncbi:hypothetical protein [Gloeobacter morelensis]|uniref:Uncharacterized protein n=1 Tax=Gloeobacter morelensis MG652769 TaxID=2781736 RepID=A0ABY3PP02_9CYAN|nr:hypothetical protein [Gloeobacter morelensis]UFP95416.1 hypothetical protein ISF26_03980 [Gloeobacter morelensis MG652769]
MYEQIKSRTGWLWLRLQQAFAAATDDVLPMAVSARRGTGLYPPGYLQRLKTLTLKQLLNVHRADLRRYLAHKEAGIEGKLVTTTELVTDCRQAILAVEGELRRRGAAP